MAKTKKMKNAPAPPPPVDDYYDEDSPKAEPALPGSALTLEMVDLDE